MMRKDALGIALVVWCVASSAQAEPLSFPIVGTGQQTCYGLDGQTGCSHPGGPLFGQDAQHPGPQPAYQDQGDGTVRDLITGLIWEKGFRRSQWADAAAVARQARTGGYQDWRVPTIKELYSLIHFDGRTGQGRPESTSAPADAKPYLDTDVFAFEYPSQGRYIDAQYISATAYGGITMGRDHSFFGVNFADGRIKAYPQHGGPVSERGYYLRLVRGNPGYGHNAFSENDNGTISDRATGLMWQQDDLVNQTWQGALAACEGATTAGFTDWRLPNAKELQSIVDYTRSPQATGTAALDPLFHIQAMTDESGRRNWPSFWTSTTHLDGRPLGGAAVYLAFGEALGKPSFGGPPPGGERRDGPPPGAGRRGDGPPLPGFGPRGGADAGSRGPGIVDVHGAGAQRSSPKAMRPDEPVRFQGPQGDVVRPTHSVRCIRTEHGG